MTVERRAYAATVLGAPEFASFFRAEVDADLDLVFLVLAPIGQRVHHVEHERQSQAAGFEGFDGGVVRRGFARIEGPPGVPDFQHDLLIDNAEPDVDRAGLRKQQLPSNPTTWQ